MPTDMAATLLEQFKNTLAYTVHILSELKTAHSPRQSIATERMTTPTMQG